MHGPQGRERRRGRPTVVQALLGDPDHDAGVGGPCHSCAQGGQHHQGCPPRCAVQASGHVFVLQSWHSLAALAGNQGPIKALAGEMQVTLECRKEEGTWVGAGEGEDGCLRFPTEAGATTPEAARSGVWEVSVCARGVCARGVCVSDERQPLTLGIVPLPKHPIPLSGWWVHLSGWWVHRGSLCFFPDQLRYN